MNKKQRREHKLGNALRAERGGKLYTQPNPSWRVKARIIRWSQAVEFHDGAKASSSAPSKPEKVKS